MTSKSMVFAFVLMGALALVSGFSVMGLLQSSERIGASGIVVRPAPPPDPPLPPPDPPPPEPSIEIDVYGDEGCTVVLSSVDWGSVEAGGSVDRVVYVKNSGDGGVVLSLLTENWIPEAAADYLMLSWDYDGGVLGSGGVVGVTLTLDVDSSVSGVDDFGFDIVIVASAS
jgi:hypothetical protein